MFSADVMLFKRQDARFGERLHDRKVVLLSGSFSSGIPRSPSPCITTIHLAAIFICWPVVALHADDCGDDRSKQLPGPSNAHQCFQSSKWTWLFLQKYLNERSVPLLVTVVHDESLSELSIYNTCIDVIGHSCQTWKHIRCQLSKLVKWSWHERFLIWLLWNHFQYYFTHNLILSE